jgi:glycosyltransferase involved in cell wall biosynthesis
VVSENRIGIVHSHHRFTSLIGRAVAAVERVPFVSTMHDLAPGSRFLTRMGIGKVVTVFSKAVSEHLRNDFGVSAERVERVPMGLFDESSRRPESFILEEDRTPVIAFAGRLAVEKGIHVLVEALALMQGRVTAKVLIIGDGEERDSVIQTLQARGLADSVTLTGFVEDIGPMLARSDVVVVPSLREGFGRVVIEALAAGVPVIASATGGIVELVRDQENGLLVPAGDAHALAAAIVRVLSDRDLAAHLRDGARAASVDVYSVQGMADAMSRIYRRLSPALGQPA